jgi:hypothetical protein
MSENSMSVPPMEPELSHASALGAQIIRIASKTASGKIFFTRVTSPRKYLPPLVLEDYTSGMLKGAKKTKGSCPERRERRAGALPVLADGEL